MSRAFVSEADGWLRCARLGDDCMFAKEGGECALPQCRRPEDLPPVAPAKPN